MIIDDLIEEYKKLPRYCYAIDYNDKNAVEKNNKSVKRMYQIVETINIEFGIEGIQKLKPLLDIVDFRTNIWIATHLIEKVSLDKETENKALDIIKKVAEGNDLSALGYQYWLRDWNSNRDR